MRVVLIRPDLPYLVSPNAYGPLGLGYLCAYVRQEMPHVDIEICDMAVGEIPDTRADVYGWTSSSLDYEHVVELAVSLHYKALGAKQVLGGPHATVFREACDPVFDAVFVGEGEKSLVAYLRGLEDGTKWQQRVWMPDPVADLDEIPFPVRKRPEEKQLVHGHSKSITVMASRGCPFNCSFCASDVMWDRGIRWRSPTSVVTEISEAKQDLGITDVAMIDDCLTVNRRWLAEFCAQMRPVGVQWRALSRVDIANETMFGAMHAAGCTEVCFGVESFDQTVLDALNKHTTPYQAVNAIRMAKACGLQTRVFMMISTPGESAETVDTNIAHMTALEHDIDFVTLSTFMPLPGTPIYDQPQMYGVKIVDPDLSHHNRYQWAAEGERPVWSPIEIEGLPRETQLQNIARMRTFVGEHKSANRGRPV